MDKMVENEYDDEYVEEDGEVVNETLRRVVVLS
jgi:hypothetical protein